jgi:hypothetical protein
MLLAAPCHAYIGPGLGAGVLAVVGGVLVSIVATIFAVTYYPIKRALKKKREARGQSAENSSDHDKTDQTETSEP